MLAPGSDCGGCGRGSGNSPGVRSSDTPSALICTLSSGLSHPSWASHAPLRQASGLDHWSTAFRVKQVLLNSRENCGWHF